MTPQQQIYNLRRLPGLENATIYADPSVFYRTQAQSEGDFKSIADLYIEAGLTNLCEAQDAELAGMERILEHWRDLENREPTLRIVCPEDHSRRRYGLFPNGCPNLVWELMRTRRAQLSASQLMRKNPTEAIVDKDNHLRDCLKYVVLSRPAPAEVPHSITRERIIQEAFQDGTYGTLGVRLAQLNEQERRESEPVSYLPRLPTTNW